MKFFLLILFLSSFCFGRNLEFQSKLIEGSQYFGGVQSPKTNLQSLAINYSSENSYGVNFSYIYNGSYLKLYTLSVFKDFMWELNDQSNLGIYLALGSVNYRETSSFQSVSLFGFSNSIGIKGSLKLNEKFSITAGYGNEHHWITKNFFDYWGSDPRSDYVFDLTGPFIGLKWGF